MSLVLAILENCLKRLSEDSNQAMADPTADVRQLADHEADKRYQNVTLTSAIVADCRRKQGGRNQGSSQLTVWQWLTRVECKLTSQTTNSKQTKKKETQDTSNYSKPQKKAGKVQTKANTANTFRALLL